MVCRHARLVWDCQFSTAMMVRSASRLGTVYITAWSSAIVGKMTQETAIACHSVAKLPLVLLRR